MYDLVVLYEHPEWQKPLWAALERRGVRYAALDLKRAAFDPDAVPEANLYFNQASPSAYVRGNTRAVPLALSLMRSLELGGARVLNGSRAFLLELSKSAQAALLRTLGIPHPHSLVFNDPEAALAQWSGGWPALLKPEQGGSGARMFLLHSAEELRKLLREQPSLWLPDNLLLLQEYFPVDAAQGIVRMEFLGGKLLYAMRVISHGAFNLCPSEACNPEGGGESAVCHPGASIGQTGGVLSLQRRALRGGRDGRTNHGCRRSRRRRNRISGGRRWPTDFLRHQRQFQPSRADWAGVRIRSV